MRDIGHDIYYYIIGRTIHKAIYDNNNNNNNNIHSNDNNNDNNVSK